MKIKDNEPCYIEKNKFAGCGTITNLPTERESNQKKRNSYYKAVESHQQIKIKYNWENKIYERQGCLVKGTQK